MQSQSGSMQLFCVCAMLPDEACHQLPCDTRWLAPLLALHRIFAAKMREPTAHPQIASPSEASSRHATVPQPPLSLRGYEGVSGHAPMSLSEYVKATLAVKICNSR